MGELGALFNPGMRHEIAERKAKAARREEEGASDPGDLRIDLLSGVAVISLGRNGTRADNGAGTGTTSDGTDDMSSDQDEQPTDQDSTAQDSTAQDSTAQDGTAQDDTDQAGAHDTDGLVEQGRAPQHQQHVEVDTAEENVDQDALDIARGSSNAEPPA